MRDVGHDGGLAGHEVLVLGVVVVEEVHDRTDVVRRLLDADLQPRIIEWQVLLRIPERIRNLEVDVVNLYGTILVNLVDNAELGRASLQSSLFEVAIGGVASAKVALRLRIVSLLQQFEVIQQILARFDERCDVLGPVRLVQLRVIDLAVLDLATQHLAAKVHLLRGLGHRDQVAGPFAASFGILRDHEI